MANAPFYCAIIHDYRDWLDYVIVEDGRDVDPLCEDRHSRTELRWFWSTRSTSLRSSVSPRTGARRA
jgi:hypothetical protein